MENAKGEQERISAERKLEKMEQLRKGLVGQRLGKHKVAEGEIDVQLGEDLSESLRGLKVGLIVFHALFLTHHRLKGIFSETVSSACRRGHSSNHEQEYCEFFFILFAIVLQIFTLTAQRVERPR